MKPSGGEVSLLLYKEDVSVMEALLIGLVSTHMAFLDSFMAACQRFLTKPSELKRKEHNKLMFLNAPLCCCYCCCSIWTCAWTSDPDSEHHRCFTRLLQETEVTKDRGPQQPVHSPLPGTPGPTGTHGSRRLALTSPSTHHPIIIHQSIHQSIHPSMQQLCKGGTFHHKWR